MMRASIIFAAALLAGCAMAPKPTPITPPLKAVCLPLGNVTPAQQKAASAALSNLSVAQQAALAPLLEDWVAMRDADRACLKAAN